MAFAAGCRILFRKGGVASSVSAIMLLVAIIASTDAIVNYLSLQSETLAGLVTTSNTYLILSSNSTTLTDSRLDIGLAERMGSLSYVKYLLPQKLLAANLTTNSGTTPVQVVGVADVGSFLEARGAYVNGTAAKGIEEADIGGVLARALSIGPEDRVSLSANERRLEVKVVGVFRSQTQGDAELIVPMQAADMLSGDNATISFIELSLKQDADARQALGKITQLLPRSVRLIPVQQIKEFTQQINAETLAFLNAWSLAVYAVVAVASYVIATRLITEASYELTMLRALGAKKHLLFALVVAYTASVAFAGSIMGMALGTVGTQVASTLLGWFASSVRMAPFLAPEEVLQAMALTLASSLLGCIYPALKCAQMRYMQEPL